MLHLVIKPHDGNYPIEEVCKSLFGENKCLVMMEKKGGDHCHVQGVLSRDISDHEWKTKISPELNALHYRRKIEPKSNPVKKRKLAADETGFQYMSKELPSSIVLYKQGISDDELQELYEKSNEYREELQAKLGEYIFKACGDELGTRTAAQLHKCMCTAALQYYVDQDKMHPPNLKMLVRYYMMKYYWVDNRVKEYLSELMM